MISVKKTIAKNMFWLFSGEFLIRAFKLVLIIAVARILGAFQYGLWSFPASLAIILSMFANFGFSEINTRELSKGHDIDKSSVISLQWFFSFCVFLITIILSLLLSRDVVTIRLIWLLAIAFNFGEMAEFFYSFFRSINNIKYEAITKAIQGCILMAVGLLLLFNYPNIVSIAIAYSIASIVAFVTIFVFYRKKFQSFKFKINKSAWSKYIKMSWPVGLMLFFVAIYNYIDSVMMGFLGQVTAVGWYNAAYRIVLALMLVPVLFNRAFMPILSQNYKTDRFKKIFRFEAIILVAGTLLMMVLGILLSGPIIHTIFGSEYSPSVLAFEILIIMAGVHFLTYLMYQILIISNNQHKIFSISLFGAILNILLNIILIPKYSLYGAASATLVTYVSIAILTFYYTRKVFRSI